MVKRRLLIAGRVFFGLLALTALTIQFAVHVLHGFSAINFFSYFTNLSNVFAAIVLLTAATQPREGGQSDKLFDIIRGASVVAMALVGVVYITLLRQEDLGSLLPWINVVIHYVMPVVVVADWFCDPPESELGSRHLRYWLIFPSAYLTYSFIRGAFMGWYAYPFFDPDNRGGYVAVFAYCLGMLAVFLLFGWLLVRASNRPRPHQHAHPRHQNLRAKHHGKK